MTLVVVQQKGAVISAVSDTGVIEHNQKRPFNQQVPKICILAPDLAVGFAGQPDLSLSYLQQYPAGSNYRETVAYFVERNIESNRQADFIVMFNSPVPKIIRVTDGKASPPVRAAWIGDQSAFEAFQRYRLTKAVASVASVFEAAQLITIQQSEKHHNNMTFEMLGALRYVIIDPAVETVFGLGVAANNIDGDFQFRSHTFMLTERKFSIALPDRFLAKAVPERDELRMYAASCFVMGRGFDVQGLAYHFVHGKVTYMYWGKRGQPLSMARVIAGKNIEEFMHETKDEFGIEWTGTLTLRTSPPKDYGIAANKWKINAPTGPRVRPRGLS